MISENLCSFNVYIFRQINVTFKMILSTVIQKHFENEYREPVVDIRSNLDGFSESMLTMKPRLDDFDSLI